MKRASKLLALIVFVLGFHLSSEAQIKMKLIVGSEAGQTGDSVCIPVICGVDVSLLDMQFGVSWDPTILGMPAIKNSTLSYESFTSLEGIVQVVWEDQSSAGRVFHAGEILFEICAPIIANSGSSVLDISQNIFQMNFVMSAGLCIPCSVTKGLLTVNQAGQLSPRIQGRVYNDNNADGVFNSGDTPIPYHFVESIEGNYFSVSRLDGTYNMVVDPGIAYTIKAIIPQNNYFILQPVAHTLPTNAAFNETYSSRDFALTTYGDSPDLEVDIICSTIRPGFISNYYMSIKNVGTETLSGSVDLKIDQPLEFLSSKPPPSSIDDVNYIYTYDFEDLEIFKSILIPIKVYLDFSTPLGAIVNTSITGTIEGNEDVDRSNNTSFCDNMVVGSYDPNDKVVSDPEIKVEQLADEKYKTAYTIRFQNLGNFYAERIVVRDTISDQFDLRSIEFVASSHPCQIQIVKPNGDLDGRNIIEWTFPYIFLPAKIDDEPGSHGFVKFKIKPLGNLPIGEDIKNRASIFFDFNEPVLTNVTNSKVVITSATSDIISGIPIQLFPNPTKGDLQIKWNNSLMDNASLEILDLKGSIILRYPDFSSGDHLDLQKLPAGMYQVRVQNGVNVGYDRFVKVE